MLVQGQEIYSSSSSSCTFSGVFDGEDFNAEEASIKSIRSIDRSELFETESKTKAAESQAFTDNKKGSDGSTKRRKSTAAKIFERRVSRTATEETSGESERIEWTSLGAFEPYAEEEEFEYPKPSAVVEETPAKDSIFVYSPPSQFPDIMSAKKSAFGSVFVKAPVPVTGRVSRRGSTNADQFNAVPVTLEELVPGRSPRRSTRGRVEKGSVFRAFEKRGIARNPSVGGSSQWDVFPITKSGLFSFHYNDRVHQTKDLSKIEERIASAPLLSLKFSRSWPTGSSWTGNWDGLGMAGSGTFIMPHDVTYVGKMQDGVCHDEDATLIYPNGFKVIHCNFVKGVLTDYQFKFPDGLTHKKTNWNYCQYPDRRFWSEIQNGLKPGKVAQKTQADPPRKILPEHYDTNDGFYNVRSKMLVNEEGELIRVPQCDEERWIIENCRKDAQEFTGFRPDLFENWFNNDTELIDSMKAMQKKYKRGDIDRNELYQFYEHNNIVSSRWAKIKSFTNLDDIASKQTNLIYHLEKRYEGHTFKTKREQSVTSKKQKLPLRRLYERKASAERALWKIKINEEAKTPATGSGGLTDKKEDAKDARRNFGTQSAYRETASSEVSKEGEWQEEPPERKIAIALAKGIILNILDDIASRSVERDRDRLVFAQSIGNLPFSKRTDKENCIGTLQDLYSSAPEADEFCDSFPEYDCDLKNLNRDRLHTQKYWGTRIFKLEFDEN